MFRLLLLLIIMAGVGAYFTKPDRAAQQHAAEQTLHDAQSAAASHFDIGGMLDLGVASIAQDGRYEDLYLVSKYTVSAAGHDVAQCWGAFTQVRCTIVPPTASPPQPAAS